jgi:hypothetical protein
VTRRSLVRGRRTQVVLNTLRLHWTLVQAKALGGESRGVYRAGQHQPARGNRDRKAASSRVMHEGSY